ncbi:MAG: cytochrome c [Pseudomonadota bacterium]|nr:cytochrome c [Pseudomonadota bacterium]
MNRLLKFVGGVVLGAALLPAAASADDKEIIEYRQHIMNALNEQGASLGMIMSFAVPDDNTVAHFQVIALLAKTSLEAFEPKVQGGDSKPEVWAQWPDFSKRMKEFAEHSANVAKLGAAQGKEVAMNHVLDALPCKACHDIYREEPKE